MVLPPDHDVVISFTSGGWVSNYEYRIDTSRSVDGSSSRFYELWEGNDWVSGSTDHVYGFELQYVLDNGVIKNRLVVNSGNNTTPALYSVNSTSSTSLNEFWIETGDVVRAWDGNNLKFEFTCFAEMLYRPEEPATGTEGTSSTSVSYVVADNELRIVISPDEETTEIAGTANANRRTYYQLRKLSGTEFFQEIAHTKGWSTYHTIVPPSPGTYLLERVRTNPVEYHSFNSVEVTQAQLDAWHTANNGHIFYDPAENYLHYFIHSSEDTTNLLFGSAGRELFYRVRSVNQSVHNFNHLHDYDTNGTYRPTAHGIYHLERVLTNPLEVLSYAYAEVTQSQLDAWNLLNAPPVDDSGNNAPPNTPRGRRGNHNFW